MIAREAVERKRDGGSLDPDELSAFLAAYLADEVPDYQMAAFLMAVYFRGLDPVETDVLVRSMLGSGATLDLSHIDGVCVDKHSTGGVGDKVSLALAPLAAALGLYVPMMSGRGLGHTTGTLDKLEAIPGFRTGLDLEEFASVLERVGCAMIGQTADIAPLDRRLYALRDVTATVPVIPLIAASIMSKKLAEDLDGLLLDVKVGDGAFLPDRSDALELARTMVAIGEERGLRTRVLVTAMDRPLGVAVGNGLETAEAIDCLRGGGPDDLRSLVIEQAIEMTVLAEDRTDLGEIRSAAERALDSGAALDRFRRLVEAQGGDPSVIERPERLRTAPCTLDVTADRSGSVACVAPRMLGEAVIRLGGGRVRVDQDIDPGVGFEVHARPGGTVRQGERLGVVHARTSGDAEAAARVLGRAVRIVEEGVGMEDEPLPLVVERLGGVGGPG